MSVDILDFFLILMNLPTKEDVSDKNITSLVPIMAGVLRFSIKLVFFFCYKHFCLLGNNSMLIQMSLSVQDWLILVQNETKFG